MSGVSEDLAVLLTTIWFCKSKEDTMGKKTRKANSYVQMLIMWKLRKIIRSKTETYLLLRTTWMIMLTEIGPGKVLVSISNLHPKED
jgi:hypothetical protein